MLRSIFGRVAAATLMALTASFAHAQTLAITAPVNEGAAQTINGTGAPANGPVELYKNGVSQGSVFADGSGNFTFTNIAVTPSDVVHAACSQVWNFNTDGNDEGWTVADATDTTSVVGGIATFTEGSGNGNLFINIFSATGLGKAPITRALEVRWRHVGAGAPAGTSCFVGSAGADGIAGTGDDGFGFAQNFPALAANGSLVTFHTDLGLQNSGADSVWMSGPIGTQIGLTMNGLTNGDQIQIDYVRVSEYYEFSFSNPGDLENFTPDANTNAVVAGGNLTLTHTVGGGNPGVTGPFTWIDSNYYTRLQTRIQTTSSITPNLFFFNYFGGASVNPAGYQVGQAANGSFEVLNIDLSAPPAYGGAWTAGPIGSLNLAGTIQGLFAGAAGENAVIDYWRLQTATPFGPSPAVTVQVPVELSGFATE